MNDRIPIDAGELKRAASGRWLEILPAIDQRFSEAAKKAPNHVPCPIGTGSEDGFRFAKDSASDGHAFTNTGEPLGDGFKVLQWANNWDFREALVAVHHHIYPTGDHQQRQPAQKDQQPIKASPKPKQDRTALINRLINESTTSLSSVAKAYLNSRGLPDQLVGIGDAIRSHQAMGYYHQKKQLGSYPALVGIITDRNGKAVGIQRHYLNQDGSKLQLVDPENQKALTPKSMISVQTGAASGGAVKLGQYDSKARSLCICEGLETALAVQTETTIETWAGLTATMLSKVDVPADRYTTVFIFADKDKNGTGRKSARTLADRLTTNGLTVYIMEPPQPIPANRRGVDWLDTLVELGNGPFISVMTSEKPNPYQALTNTEKPKQAGQQQPKEVNPEQKSKQTGGELQQAIQALNKEYTHVVTGGKNYVVAEGTNALGHKEMVFYKPEEFRTMMGHRPKATVFTQSGAPRKQNVGAAWLEHEDANVCYNGVTFHPVNERFYRGRLNTYFGYGVEPIPHEAEEIRLYLEHVHQIICAGNDEHYRYLMSWLADMIQNPAQKPGVAVILKAGQGTGKGSFLEPLGQIIGSHYCYANRPDVLTGKFNSLLENKVLIFADEAFFGSKAATDQLKTLITEPTNTIERKGVDRITVPDFSRIIMASNKDGIVSIEEDERRYFYLEVSEERKQDQEYFGKLRDLIDNGQLAGKLLDLLQRWDINDFNPRVVPKTQALTDQKINNLAPLARWLFECLQDERIAGGCWTRTSIPADELRDSVREWLESRNLNVFGDLSRQLGRELKKVGIDKQRTRDTSGGRFYRYNLPTIDATRAAFEQRICGKIDW